MSALPSAAAEPTLSELRAGYREGKAALLDAFGATRATAAATLRLLRALTRHADRHLAAVWARSAMPRDAALVAVGGYGRGELFPYSDVDVLVLLPPGREPGADDAGLRQTIERFIAACWDSGIEIGSSVRTVDECVAEGANDVTVQTSLLEARRVCGSRRAFAALRDANAKSLDAKAFFVAKTLEMRQRHQKFDDTPYSLEPNCKESPGGLRDLQVVIWVARAAGLGRSWRELAASGLITAFEARQLGYNEGVIKLIRARLHAIAGRREDRLVFDLQTAVAESFGYRSTPEARASEQLMRRYYWAAKAVGQLNQIVMQNIEERVRGSVNAPMRPINERFLDRGGMLEVASDDLYLREPAAILESFLLYQRTPGIKGLSARTLRALYNARSTMTAAWRHDPANRAQFRQILQEPEGQTHAFRLMNQTSVLGRYLWVFRRIVGRMQHDLFHVYTVDQHILMVLRNVRRFLIPEHAHEYPFCSQLASQFDRVWVLYVAALFHDVAKGRGGDHSELGAVEVRRFCRAHGIGGEDAALIELLVRKHLLMSQVAQKEDLSDPDVIQAFVREVDTERKLTALYLLTVADVRGTSPKVWNAWKGKLLEDLYRLALRALGGAHINLDAEIETRKHDARELLGLLAVPRGAEAALWATLEISYFARHDAGDIAWHARELWQHVDSADAIVRARPSPLGEGLQVLVYARDRPDLFARICGFFDSTEFDIVDAKVHTSRSAYALDTFQVIGPQPDVDSRALVASVQSQLARALDATGPLPEPRRGRVSRRVKSFPVTPRVTLRPDERAQRWLLGISASDRIGLLYSIARVLARHQVNLQLAKITTLGERVEDTFLVDGPQLQHNRAQIDIETELLEAIAP